MTKKPEKSKTTEAFTKAKRAFSLGIKSEEIRFTNLFLNSMLHEIQYPTFDFLANVIKERTGEEIAKLRGLDSHTHAFTEKNILSTDEERHIFKAIDKGSGLIHQLQQIMYLCRLSFPEYGKTEAQLSRAEEKPTAWQNLMSQRDKEARPAPAKAASKPKATRAKIKEQLEKPVLKKLPEPSIRDEKFEGYIERAQISPRLAAAVLTTVFKSILEENNISSSDLKLGAADVRSLLAPSVSGQLPTQEQIDSLRTQMNMNNAQYAAVCTIAALAAHGKTGGSRKL